MPKLLTTKTFNSAQKNLLLQAGLSFVEYNAISIKLDKAKTLPRQSENAIFTSKNAYRAIGDRVKIHKAYCVGQKTAALLQSEGVPVIATAKNSTDLGKRLLTDFPERHFEFFCGNKRRNELPELLTSNGIPWREFIVYRTSARQKTFEAAFDGILFFSPSGVYSFIAANSINEIPVFCIGKTTARAAQTYFNKVIIANRPSIESTITQAAFYFKNKKGPETS